MATIELTPDQSKSLQTNHEPPSAYDPATQTTYVLVRSERYERVKTLLQEDDDFAAANYATSMQLFGKEGWDDPAMDVYNELDPRRQA
jgi:hypothetical protein